MRRGGAGCGLLGSALARNFATSGLKIAAWNRTPVVVLRHRGRPSAWDLRLTKGRGLGGAQLQSYGDLLVRRNDWDAAPLTRVLRRLGRAEHSWRDRRGRERRPARAHRDPDSQRLAGSGRDRDTRSVREAGQAQSSTSVPIGLVRRTVGTSLLAGANPLADLL